MGADLADICQRLDPIHFVRRSFDLSVADPQHQG